MGSSGSKIVVTLVHALKKGEFGAAGICNGEFVAYLRYILLKLAFSLCIAGGGGGSAMIIEKLA